MDLTRNDLNNLNLNKLFFDLNLIKTRIDDVFNLINIENFDEENIKNVLDELYLTEYQMIVNILKKKYKNNNISTFISNIIKRKHNEYLFYLKQFYSREIINKIYLYVFIKYVKHYELGLMEFYNNTKKNKKYKNNYNKKTQDILLSLFNSISNLNNDDKILDFVNTEQNIMNEQLIKKIINDPFYINNLINRIISKEEIKNYYTINDKFIIELENVQPYYLYFIDNYLESINTDNDLNYTENQGLFFFSGLIFSKKIKELNEIVEIIQILLDNGNNYRYRKLTLHNSYNSLFVLLFIKFIKNSNINIEIDNIDIIKYNDTASGQGINEKGFTEILEHAKDYGLFYLDNNNNHHQIQFVDLLNVDIIKKDTKIEHNQPYLNYYGLFNTYDDTKQDEDTEILESKDDDIESINNNDYYNIVASYDYHNNSNVKEIYDFVFDLIFNQYPNINRKPFLNFDFNTLYYINDYIYSKINNDLIDQNSYHNIINFSDKLKEPNTMFELNQLQMNNFTRLDKDLDVLSKLYYNYYKTVGGCEDKLKLYYSKLFLFKLLFNNIPIDYSNDEQYNYLFTELYKLNNNIDINNNYEDYISNIKNLINGLVYNNIDFIRPFNAEYDNIIGKDGILINIDYFDLDVIKDPLNNFEDYKNILIRLYDDINILKHTLLNRFLFNFMENNNNNSYDNDKINNREINYLIDRFNINDYDLNNIITKTKFSFTLPDNFMFKEIETDRDFMINIINTTIKILFNNIIIATDINKQEIINKIIESYSINNVNTNFELELNENIDNNVEIDYDYYKNYLLLLTNSKDENYVYNEGSTPKIVFNFIEDNESKGPYKTATCFKTITIYMNNLNYEEGTIIMDNIEMSLNNIFNKENMIMSSSIESNILQKYKSINMNYYDKYIKYKNKYLKLKKLKKNML